MLTIIYTKLRITRQKAKKPMMKGYDAVVAAAAAAAAVAAAAAAVIFPLPPLSFPLLF